MATGTGLLKFEGGQIYCSMKMMKNIFKGLGVEGLTKLKVKVEKEGKVTEEELGIDEFLSLCVKVDKEPGYTYEMIDNELTQYNDTKLEEIKYEIDFKDSRLNFVSVYGTVDMGEFYGEVVDIRQVVENLGLGDEKMTDYVMNLAKSYGVPGEDLKNLSVTNFNNKTALYVGITPEGEEYLYYKENEISYFEEVPEEQYTKVQLV